MPAVIEPLPDRSQGSLLKRDEVLDEHRGLLADLETQVMFFRQPSENLRIDQWTLAVRGVRTTDDAALPCASDGRV